MTKYNFNIDIFVLDNLLTRLTNQIWKLIPMRENQENWEKQLDSVIIEIAGLNEIFSSVPIFLQLLAKLEGLKAENEITFDLYRKTVFECLTLIQGLKCYEK